MEQEGRVYLVDLDGNLHDRRSQKATRPLVYHNHSCAVGQRLARTLREARLNGIGYDRIRCTGSECAAVFWVMLEVKKQRLELGEIDSGKFPWIPGPGRMLRCFCVVCSTCT